MGARIDYPAAVELQSTIVDSLKNIYGHFLCGLGMIWCMDRDVKDGADEVEIGSAPSHDHPESRAEGTTMPLSRWNGGALIGRSTVGEKNLISTSDFSPLHSTPVRVI